MHIYLFTYLFMGDHFCMLCCLQTYLAAEEADL